MWLFQATFCHNMTNKCTSCNKSFTSRYKLTIHKHQQHPNEPITHFCCGHCRSVFSLARNLVRHLKTQHKFERCLKCSSCQTFFGTLNALTEHSHVNHNVRQQPASESRTLGISHLHTEKRSVRGFFRTFRFTINDEDNYDPLEFSVTNESAFCDFLKSKMTSDSMKFSLCLQSEFEKPLKGDKTSCFFK